MAAQLPERSPLVLVVDYSEDQSTQRLTRANLSQRALDSLGEVSGFGAECRFETSAAGELAQCVSNLDASTWRKEGGIWRPIGMTIDAH